MAFIKSVGGKVKKDSGGIVYILIMEIEGDTVYKIGITTRKVEERVCEIITSFWKKYRYFPRTETKRFKTTTGIFDKEAALHSHFSNCRYKPKYKTDGSEELFVIDDLDYLLDVYSRCLDGEDIRKLIPYEVKNVPDEE
jgi:hypothetical protein